MTGAYMRGAPAFLTAPDFGSAITHGFFGRAGGVSDGLYGGLNCGFGSGDETARVAENREQVAAALELSRDNLLTVYQTHSSDVLVVTGPHPGEDAPKADAMVSVMPGLGLAVLTADCAPVLFVDERAGVIGAAHAGWKGALGSVLENTIEAMVALGAACANIAAAIGPSISQTNYEVGAEFKARFLVEDRSNDRFFVASPKQDHSMFDLPAFCAHRLKTAGVFSIHDVAKCTYGGENAYFSYRRATHKNEPDYGRNISVIGLRP